MPSRLTEEMASFLDLPSELRNRVYEQCLIFHRPIKPARHEIMGIRFNLDHTPALAPELLCVNKKVHREASPLLYAQNCFDFEKVTTDDVVMFLATIGNKNADYIQRILIDFPILTYQRPRCAFMWTTLNCTASQVLLLDILNSPTITTKALTKIYTRFGAILSLRNTLVGRYKEGSSEEIVKKLERFGWTVKAREYEYTKYYSPCSSRCRGRCKSETRTNSDLANPELSRI